MTRKKTDDATEDARPAVPVATRAPVPVATLPEGCVWKGNPLLIPFLVPVGELHEDPSNANTHNPRSIKTIGDSYHDHGQQKPIVCSGDLVVRDGNGQYRAAAETLGWTQIAALPSNLEGIELTSYALTVNRSSQLSEWDYENLAGQLRGIRDAGGDVERLGWEPFEIEPLMSAEWQPPARDSANGSATGGGGTAEAGGTPAHVVQLVLDETTHKEYEWLVAAAAPRLGTGDPTTTVMEALRRTVTDRPATDDRPSAQR